MHNLSSLDNSTAAEASDDSAGDFPSDVGVSGSSDCALAGETIVGDCIYVHIENLVGPAESHAVRPVSLSHVTELEKSLLGNQQQYKLLAGLLVEGEPEDADRPGQCRVECIGGNHTRLALQSLYSRGLWKASTVKVVLYRDISEEECLRVGIQHNKVDNYSLKLSFLDEVQLIRRLISNSETLLKARELMQKVFQLQSMKEVRHNLKTHEGVAKCSERVWEKVVAVGGQWKEKKPLRQTFFSKWLLLRSDEKKESVLDVYLRAGLSAYKEAVDVARAEQNGLEKENRKTAVEKNKILAGDKHCDCKEENAKLKAVIKSREEELEELKKECTRLKQMIENQGTGSRSTRTEDQHCTSPLTKRRIPHDREVGEVEPKKTKKVKFSAVENFEVDETVWAKYSDGISYPAKIQKINGKTSCCTVKFVEDGIVWTLPMKDMKKMAAEDLL